MLCSIHNRIFQGGNQEYKGILSERGSIQMYSWLSPSFAKTNGLFDFDQTRDLLVPFLTCLQDIERSLYIKGTS